MNSLKAILMAGLLLAGIFLHAQRSRPVQVVDHSDFIKATVFTGKTTYHPKEGVEYAWITGDEFKVTRGGYDGNLLHGYFSKYENETLILKGKYCKGRKCGLWSKWDAGGKLLETSKWSYGQLNGQLKTYDSEGLIASCINYSRGQLHGESIKYKEGEVVASKFYRHGEEVKKNKEITGSGDGKNKSDMGWVKVKKDDTWLKRTVKKLKFWEGLKKEPKEAKEKNKKGDDKSPGKKKSEKDKEPKEKPEKIKEKGKDKPKAKQD